MKTEIKKYFSNRRGEVSVAFDGMDFCVRIVTYSNLRTGRPQMAREYMKLDSVLANEYYRASVNELKGKPWVEPCYTCRYNNKVKSCTAEKCPKKLGGAEYWEIFRASCVHRR